MMKHNGDNGTKAVKMKPQTRVMWTKSQHEPAQAVFLPPYRGLSSLSLDSLTLSSFQALCGAVVLISGLDHTSPSLESSFPLPSLANKFPSPDPNSTFLVVPPPHTASVTPCVCFHNTLRFSVLSCLTLWWRCHVWLLDFVSTSPKGA